MDIKQKLGITGEYEFSHEERELLSAKLKLSLLDPTNHPLPAEIKDKALRASQEKGKINKLLNHLMTQGEHERLAGLCKVEDISNDIKNQHGNELDPLESMLIDQMSAIHKASMILLSQIYDEEGFGLESGEKFVSLSNKLMKTYQNGLQTLSQIRNSGKQTIVVKHQNVQVNGGQAIVTTEMPAGREGGKT